MYILMNNNLVNLKNLQKCFIDDKRIILQYLVGSTIITDSVNYEDVKFDVNEEKQLIEKDFEKLQNYLNGNLETRISDLEEKIKNKEKELNEIKMKKQNSEIKLQYIKFLVYNENIFKIKKYIKEELEDES